MTKKQILSNIGVFKSPVSGLETYMEEDVLRVMETYAKLKIEEFAECISQGSYYTEDVGRMIVNEIDVTNCKNNLKFD
jgi:hypothetical protein